MDKAAGFQLKIWEKGCQLLSVEELGLLLKAQREASAGEEDAEAGGRRSEVDLRRSLTRGGAPRLSMPSQEPQFETFSRTFADNLRRLVTSGQFSPRPGASARETWGESLRMQERSRSIRDVSGSKPEAGKNALGLLREQSIEE